jgi:hypothetical protein
MKKKMLIISIFAVLSMLSLPLASNINAQSAFKYEVKEKPKCSICTNQDNDNVKDVDPDGKLCENYCRHAELWDDYLNDPDRVGVVQGTIAGAGVLLYSVIINFFLGSPWLDKRGLESHCRCDID